MSVRDAETTWMSRIDMNIPNTMIRKAISRRGAILSESGAAAFIISGLAVVAFAMVSSASCQATRPRRASRLLGVNHRDRVEIGGRIGVVGALVGIDRGVDRHAGAEQILPCNL